MEKFLLYVGFFKRIALFLLLLAGIVVDASPASFVEDFKVTWADSHVKRMADNNSIQLILDQASGTVTAFYMNSDTGTGRDELDFEFLGNRSGQPYTTNVFAQGKGDREQRVNLWFDPSVEYHTYSILWNHYHIIFSVDDVPIRVYKNNEAKGVAFPKNQAMGIYSTLWEADDWATRGGVEKIDWSKAPFVAYYKDFDIEGCQVPGNATCASNPNNVWESVSYRQLSSYQSRMYRWVRMNHMIYDYYLMHS